MSKLLLIFLIVFSAPLFAASPFVMTGLETKPKTRFDWKFKASAISLAALYAIDAGQTVYHQHEGWKENNPFLGPHPSAGRVFGELGVMDIGCALASYELQRHGPRKLRRFWAGPISWGIGGHIIGLEETYFSRQIAKHR